MKSSQKKEGHRGALVIEGNYRGLGVVRSLGRRGIPVWVASNVHSLASFSRYTRRSLPWPEMDEPGQVDYLIQIAQKYGLLEWALIPTDDDSVSLIARHHNQLADYYLLTTPPWKVIHKLTDKRCLNKLAAENGVPHPWTAYPKNRDELAGLSCNYPVILKPAERLGFNPFVHEKAWKVMNDVELMRRYDEACQYVSPELVMVQEWIPGAGEEQYSYAGLFQDGQPLVELSARRTRQYPRDFGRFSTFVETIDQPDLEESARRLLAVLNYTGLIEIEFKRDPRNGLFKVLDANPRVWGWHTIGQHVGLDFSYLLWQMIHGEPICKQRGPTGIKWARLMTDLFVGIQEIRAGNLTPGSYLASLRGPIEYAIISWSDPLPGLVEIPLLLKLALKRGAL